MKHNYEIEKWLTRMVVEKKLKYGDKIPSKEALRIKFHLSKNAVEMALINLKRLRVIYSKPKKGYFICENSQQALLKREQNIRNFIGYKIFFTNNENREKQMKTISLNLASFLLIPNKKKILSYKKYYFDSNQKIQKLSLNYDLLVDKEKQKKMLSLTTLNALLLKDYEGISKIEKITWEKVPKNILNILKISNEQVIVKYIGIFDKQKILIHTAKFYINCKFLNEKNFY